MSASNVVSLPVKAQATPALELELLGALLHLASLGKFEKKTWETMRLTGEEFATETVSKAWKIARKQGALGQSVTALTVFTAGYSHKWFTADVQPMLTGIAESNTMTMEVFRRVATDFRMQHMGLQTINRLESVINTMRSAAFDPAKIAGLLDGIGRGLHASAARIEDLTGAQMGLMNRWDQNQATGQKDTLATGIKVLDHIIGGFPKLLCVLAADAGVGKTALLDSLIHSTLLAHWDAGLNVGLISPEDGVEHVVKRWVAREMGLLLREVGSKELTPEELERRQEINGRQHEMYKRVQGYSHHELTADSCISTCWEMIDKGCGIIGIDNFNKIDLGDGPDYHRRVQRFADRLVRVAEDARVPVLMVTHMTDGETNTQGKVTATGGLQGGKAMGRVARFRMDLYRKGKALRGVIAKANELCEQGVTIEFTRQATAGLVDPNLGDIVDINEERAIERKQRAEAAEAAFEKKRKKRAAERVAEKAEADAKKAALKAAEELKKHPPELFPEAAVKSSKDEGSVPF